MCRRACFGLTLSAVLLGTAFLPTAAARDPADYSSEVGHFRVSLPGSSGIFDRKHSLTMKSETKNIPFGPGADQVVVMTTEKVEGPHGAIFSVSWVDYPADFTIEPKKVLEGAREGMKGIDGKLIQSKEVTITVGEDKFPGSEVQIEAGKNAIRSHIVLIDNRLYLVMVTGTKDVVCGQSSIKTTDSFLSSFRIEK